MALKRALATLNDEGEVVEWECFYCKVTAKSLEEVTRHISNEHACVEAEQISVVNVATQPVQSECKQTIAAQDTSAQHRNAKPVISGRQTQTSAMSLRPAARKRRLTRPHCLPLIVGPMKKSRIDETLGNSSLATENDVKREASPDYEQNKDLESNVLSRITYECKQCAWETRRHYLWHQHILKHSNRKPTTCSYCKKTVDVFRIVSNDSHRCKSCSNVFSTKFELRRHSKQEHEDGTQSTGDSTKPASSYSMGCPICMESGFADVHTLKSHLAETHVTELGADAKLAAFVRDSARTKLHSMGENLVCRVCEWRTTRHFNYHRHAWKHCLNADRFLCLYCLKYITRDMLKSTDPGVRYECQECERTFNTRYHLQTHSYQEHGIRGVGGLACAICGYTCSTKINLKKHHTIAHDGEEFVVPDSCQLLQVDDSEGRVYKCPSCDYTSSRRDSIKKHLILHQPEAEREVFQCTVTGCDFQCFSQISLNVHMKGKHNKKDQQSLKQGSGEDAVFACELCGAFTSSNEQQLFEHQDQCYLHTTDKEGSLARLSVIKKTRGKTLMFSCNICADFKATRRWNLLRHKETAHSAETASLQCSLCRYRARHKLHLVKHYTGQHRAPPPPSLQQYARARQLQRKRQMKGVFLIQQPRALDVKKRRPKTRAESFPDRPSPEMEHQSKTENTDDTQQNLSQVEESASDVDAADTRPARECKVQQHSGGAAKQTNVAHSYCCVWGCGFHTGNDVEWDIHNRELCGKRVALVTWREYAKLCDQQQQRQPSGGAVSQRAPSTRPRTANSGQSNSARVTFVITSVGEDTSDSPATTEEPGDIIYFALHETRVTSSSQQSANQQDYTQLQTFNRHSPLSANTFSANEDSLYSTDVIPSLSKNDCHSAVPRDLYSRAAHATNGKTVTSEATDQHYVSVVSSEEIPNTSEATTGALVQDLPQNDGSVNSSSSSNTKHVILEKDELNRWRLIFTNRDQTPVTYEIDGGSDIQIVKPLQT